MSVVLVVEPDAAQAAAVRKMQRRLGAELVLVNTTDEAIESIELGVPDLILLSALLSPRDEDRVRSRRLRGRDRRAALARLRDSPSASRRPRKAHHRAQARRPDGRTGD